MESVFLADVAAQVLCNSYGVLVAEFKAFVERIEQSVEV